MVTAAVQHGREGERAARFDGEAPAAHCSVRGWQETRESRVFDLPITPDWPSNGQLGYKGETTLKEAFVSSRNAAAVRLTQELGVRRVAEVSRRLGVDPGANPDPGFVLGSYSANVLNMTAAYATVANGGYRVSPSGVLAVVEG